MRPLWATTLLEIQAVDQKIAGVKTRLSLLPKERDRILAAKRAADAQIAAADRKLAVQRDAIRKMESEIHTLEDRRNRVKQQSALVRKNEEYQTLTAEIAMLDNAVSEQETRVLAEMERIPEVERLAAAEKSAAMQEIRALKQEYLEFGAAEKSFMQDLKKLQQEREVRLSQVDRKLAEPYEELHKGNDGPPLAAIEADGSCGSCSLKLTPQTLSSARAGKVVQCENCRHLIYLEDL